MLRNLSIIVSRALSAAQSLPATSIQHGAEASRCVASQTWRTLAQAAAKDTLTIDRTAVERLRKLQGEKGSPVALRIEVEGGGCSGFHYKFELDNKVNDGDVVFEQDGSRVVCDEASFDFLKGSKVEFEESMLKSAFVVSTNPNAEMTCGCGTSFALKMK